MTQLTLPSVSDSGDQDLPLPLYTAKQWVFSLAYIDQDGNASNYLYRIRDWLTGLVDAAYAQQAIRDMRREGNLFSQYVDSIHTLKEKDTRGRSQPVEYAKAEFLYRIVQDIRLTAKRQEASSLEAIKRYLAAAGVLVDEIRRDENAAAELIEDLESRHKRIREQGKKKRVNFIQTAKETHEKGRPNYGAITNAEYEILFGAAKDELVKTLGLTRTQANRFRDHISTLALQAIDASETAGAIKMQQLGRKLTTPEQIGIVRHCAHIVAPAFWQLADYLSVDLLSGRPRLESGQ
jgi:hypothetical protein